MNGKKFLPTAVVGFVVMFVLSYLWHQPVMGGFYEEQFADVARGEPKVLFIALGYLVLALVMAYLYPIGYKGGSPAKEGLRFGILVGLLVSLTSNLVYYGAYNLTLSGALVDAIWHLVEEGAGGLAIGVVFGAPAESAPEEPAPVEPPKKEPAPEEPASEESTSD